MDRPLATAGLVTMAITIGAVVALGISGGCGDDPGDRQQFRLLTQTGEIGRASCRERV